MGKIKKILENELIGGTQTTDVYPVTSTKAVYDENNKRLDNIIKELNNKVSTQLPKIEEAKNEALNNIKKNEQSAITNFNSQRVTPEMLSESTKQLIEASGGGTITNLADDEDITSVDNGTGSNVLKFADRTYNPDNFSGKGYKILRKNIVDDKNILVQDMINEENTIYEIRYDFDLNGKTITIPKGCTLYFNGGSFNNGTLSGTKTITKSSTTCYYNMNFTGSFYDKVLLIWHLPVGAFNNGKRTDLDVVYNEYDVHGCFMQAIKQANCTSNKHLIIQSGHLYFKKSIDLTVVSTNKFTIEGERGTNLHFYDSSTDGLPYAFKGNVIRIAYCNFYYDNADGVGNHTKNKDNIMFYSTAFTGCEAVIALEYCQIGACGTVFKDSGFTGRTVISNLLIGSWFRYCMDNVSCVDAGIQNSYIHGGATYDYDDEGNIINARMAPFINNTKMVMTDITNCWIEFADLMAYNDRSGGTNRMTGCMIDYCHNVGANMSLISGCTIYHYNRSDLVNWLKKYFQNISSTLDKVAIFAGGKHIIGCALGDSALYYDANTYLFNIKYDQKNNNLRSFGGINFDCDIKLMRYYKDDGKIGIMETWKNLYLLRNGEDLYSSDANNIVCPVRMKILPDPSSYNWEIFRRMWNNVTIYLSNTTSSKVADVYKVVGRYTSAYPGSFGFFNNVGQLVGWKEVLTLSEPQKGDLKTPLPPGKYSVIIEGKKRAANAVVDNAVRIIFTANGSTINIRGLQPIQFDSEITNITWSVYNIQAIIHVIKYTGDAADSLPYSDFIIHTGYADWGWFKGKPVADDLPINHSYYCYDKKTPESANNGMMIYHKGEGIWVDALGRVVS